MEYVTLNNGVKMPQVGLGTFLIPEDKLIKTIGQAYELGYRQFDTAWRYHNERTIARALKENGIKRSDVFITTKINADALYTRVRDKKRLVKVGNLVKILYLYR